MEKIINSENKKIRKAVRTYLINNNEVLAIKYNLGLNKDYLDIPGGKIEDGETPEETSIRELKEETGIEIIKQKHKGNFIIEYPDRIYDMDIFVVDEFKGNLKIFEENDSMWIPLNDLELVEKKLPSFEIIKYLDEKEVLIKILVDENHNILEIKNKNKN